MPRELYGTGVACSGSGIWLILPRVAGEVWGRCENGMAVVQECSVVSALRWFCPIVHLLCSFELPLSTFWLPRLACSVPPPSLAFDSSVAAMLGHVELLRRFQPLALSSLPFACSVHVAGSVFFACPLLTTALDPATSVFCM